MYELNFFGFRFSLYWTMLIVAAITTVVLSMFRAKRYDFGKIKSTIIAALLILYGCVGAKLLYIAEHPESSFSLRGGMSLFGSIYFIPVAFLVTVLILNIKYVKCMDFVALYGPLIFAFMRIGCYLNGCCGGIYIKIGSFGFTPPVQLLECAADVIIFFALLYREKYRLKPGDGTQYPIFMMSYALIRFLVEFWRDTPKNIFHFSEGQWFSVITFALGLGILWIIKRKEDVAYE